MSLPLKVSPAVPANPDPPRRIEANRSRPLSAGPSTVVTLASGTRMLAVPPLTYKGFSRVPVHRFGSVSALRESGWIGHAGAGRSLVAPGNSLAWVRSVELPMLPRATCSLVVSTSAPLVPEVESPCLVEGRAGDNASFEILEALPAARRRSPEDAAGPEAPLQRMLVDEGARVQRIIASDPAYAAAVAAFYLSTAALAAVRRDQPRW